MEKTEDRGGGEEHQTRRQSFLKLLKRRPSRRTSPKYEPQPPAAEPPTPTPNQVAETLILLLKNLLSRGETGKRGETPPPQQSLPETTTLEEILQTTQLKRLKTADTEEEIQEILDLLDGRLARGAVTEKTYIKVRSRWEKRLKNKERSTAD